MTNTNVNNEQQTTTTKKRNINYEGRIVLDFSEDEMKQIKEIMQKEHIPFKKTMVYIMIKKYLDIYEANKEH